MVDPFLSIMTGSFAVPHFAFDGCLNFDRPFSTECGSGFLFIFDVRCKDWKSRRVRSMESGFGVLAILVPRCNPLFARSRSIESPAYLYRVKER